MANKEVELSIILRTVNRATAGIQAVNKQLDALTKPGRELGKAIGELGEKSGFNAVVSGFRGVGKAIGDVLSKVAVVGGAVALAVHSLLGLVDEFDDLGDKSERMGVTVDFLGAMRFAAERSGASIEELDAGMQSFMTNLGAARAGKGSLFKFLTIVSPALLSQLKATKSGEQAFRLMADAMATVTDQEKRLALAEKTGLGAALVPLLSRSAKGLLELQGEFAATAGSLDEAAESAGKTDDALKNLKASTTGVKAALVTGLAPALTIIIGKMTQWFVDHRDDVKRWAIDIGERIPAAVDEVVTSIKGAVQWVAKIVEGIGGWKVAALGVAAVMAGPLVAAIATLGAALLTTPVGVVITGLAAIAAGIIAVTRETKAFKSFADALEEQRKHPPPGQTDEELAKEGERNMREQARREALSRVTGKSMDQIAMEVSTRATDLMEREFERARQIEAGGPFAQNVPRSGPVQANAPTRIPVLVKVDFTNAPKGMRATVVGNATAVDLSVGHQLGPTP